MNTKLKKALYESIMKSVAKTVKHLLNELSTLLDKKSSAEWSSIFAYNGKNIPISLSNLAFGLNMYMVDTKYRKACGINNVGYADAVKALYYELNQCFQGSSMPKGKDVAKALNDSNLSYRNWKEYKEDEKSITITCKDTLDNKYFIKCIK